MSVLSDYHKRKLERTKSFTERFGKKLITCTACSGSGSYKNGKCGSCNGTGKERQR